MAGLQREDFDRFTQKFEGAFKRVGGGKMAVDSTIVRSAVRNNKEAAFRYVELHCKMATSQPGYLQPAMIVSGAYQVEFQDFSLLEMVSKCATELNAHDILKSIKVMKDVNEAVSVPPERDEAKQWWKSSEKKEAKCDFCSARIPRGEGYLVHGRLLMAGQMKMNLGTELLCAGCFEKHGNDPREPGGIGNQGPKFFLG